MEIREISGVVIAFLVLAGVGMAIINGGKTATVAQAFSDGFANDIKAATYQGGGNFTS
jgi:succinate dehydrogenase hydrophobic anchor subunit